MFRPASNSWDIAYYTCEGEIKNTLAELVSTIGGQPFILNRRQKEIVHVAAVFMNNYVVALINA
jgi:predicted short-subunit dehydrogenase-like oxidoreductase (DUF2520 family)